MLLVFHRAGAHGHIAQDVVEVLVVLRVEHLVCAGELGLVDGTHVELAGGDDTVEGIRVAGRVGLVHQALIALTSGARLVGVDARHDHDLVLHALLQAGQAGDVVHHGVLVVCRAGADDEDDALVLAGEDLLQLDAAALDQVGTLGRQRVHLLDFHGDGQLALEVHVHVSASSRVMIVIRLCQSVICILVKLPRRSRRIPLREHQRRAAARNQAVAPR